MLQCDGRIAEIAEDRDPLHRRHQFAEELEPLAGGLGECQRQTRDVATGSGQACDRAIAHRIGARRDDDRDRGRLSLRIQDLRVAVQYDDVDVVLHELRHGIVGALDAALCPAEVNRDVATVGPSEFSQPLHERGDVGRGDPLTVYGALGKAFRQE